MKNRRGGVFRNTLVRDIEACPNKNLSADEVVNYLRSAFKQYERTKVRELTRQVQSILQETRTKKLIDDGASDSSCVASKSDKDEDKDDSNLEEEFEPKFDLMKSLVRDGYNEVGEKRKRVREDEEAVELEVVTNNDSRRNQKVDLAKSRAKKRVIIGQESDRRGGSEERGGDNVRAHGGPKFKDLGGMKDVVGQLMWKVIAPLFYNQHLRLELGYGQPTGILLHGPPGCGKTTLARAIANETGLPFYMISATELVSGISGESEENIRELFSKAHRTAPSIVFIDEIDAIASKRENQQREMEKRIATQLMTCMDESHQLRKPDPESLNSNARPGYVLVIGATNKPDALDPALRRTGRFDLEFVLPVPDESARVQILSVLTQKVKVEDNIDSLKIARLTPGFVGADLVGLINEAGSLAFKRTCELGKENGGENQDWEWLKQTVLPEEVAKSSITMADCEVAARTLQPSTRREGFSDIPDVKWDDIGGLHQLRQEFDAYIIQRIKFPERCEKRGLDDLERGFLLYGPPGCGKTLIAKAVANEAGASFIHIKGPELLDKFVGESESNVRTLFSRARTCSPCIIFIDEVDALTTKRGKKGAVTQQINQFLVELDGAGDRKGVYVIGATNRPEAMDRALLRGGRFGEFVYVPLPSVEERGLILKTLARKKHIDAGVDLMAIGRDLCKNFSGADLKRLINKAAKAAHDDDNGSDWSTPVIIKYEHFIRALEKVSPSVSKKDIRRYRRLRKRFISGF